MLALQIQNGRPVLNDVPRPENESEAVVRVLKSGICGTDLELVRGYSGFQGTLGHEFVGVVESAADAPELVGKRVVGEINAGCGACEFCTGGDPRHCPSRTVLGIVGRDGAHAEFLQLPAQNLLTLPDNVSNEAAVFVEPLAAAYGITEQVEILPETKIAVIGDGKLGILCARSLRLISNNVSLIGKHPEKLALAGKSDIEVHLKDEIKNLNRQFDIVVEASGSESGFATALDLVRPKGKIVLKSTFHGMPTWQASRVVVDEITVVGSRCGRFGPAIELLASNQIEVKDLITEEYEIGNGVAAFDRAGANGVLKVLLRMNRN